MSELTIELLKQKQIDERNAPVHPFEKMHNCPFCGSDYLTIRTEDEFHWGHCLHCQSTGPENTTRYNAIQMWNSRFAT